MARNSEKVGEILRTRFRPNRIAAVLAFGGFAVGTSEFVTMGLLPDVARGLSVSVPEAAFVVSAYALGVVIGAPAVALIFARTPRRGLLIAMLGVFTGANIASALSTSLGQLLVARLVSGVPHGAYFGLATLLAAGTADEARRGTAVSITMLGIPLSMLLGVPAATWLGQAVGWQGAFLLVAALSVIAIGFIVWMVPSSPGELNSSAKLAARQLLQRRLALTFGGAAIGFGGMFAMYSYIAPTAVEITGIPYSAVPGLLFTFGLGATIGTTASGWMTDRSASAALLIGAIGMSLSLAAFAASLGELIPAALTLTLVAASSSVLVVSLQVRLMDIAGDAQSLAAMLHHASLNLANAFGAWLGGIAIAMGYGYRSPSIVGAGLAACGFVVLSMSVRAKSAPNAAATGN